MKKIILTFLTLSSVSSFVYGEEKSGQLGELWIGADAVGIDYSGEDMNYGGRLTGNIPVPVLSMFDVRGSYQYLKADHSDVDHTLQQIDLSLIAHLKLLIFKPYAAVTVGYLNDDNDVTKNDYGIYNGELGVEVRVLPRGSLYASYTYQDAFESEYESTNYYKLGANYWLTNHIGLHASFTFQDTNTNARLYQLGLRFGF